MLSSDSCDASTQLLRVYSASDVTPHCGSWDVESRYVTTLTECRQWLCQHELPYNVAFLRLEDSLCSLQFCDSWDLELQGTNSPNTIYVLLPGKHCQLTSAQEG